MSPAGSAWKALLARAAGVFTAPSFNLFSELASAWVCATGRRTVCSMVAVMDPATRSAHDAYHRLVQAGAFGLEALWTAMVAVVVEHLGPEGPVICYLDDTLFHRAGRKVDGAGSFRDAVRSTRSRVVYAFGLNLVVLAVRIDPPWGGMPVALPVGVALHRKGGAKLPALAVLLMTGLAERLPGRRFVLCADGAYACLAGEDLPRTTVVSRMRRDAALFGPKPAPTGRRGRPRTRGERLPTPPEMAGSLRRRQFRAVTVEWRGRSETRLVWSREVLWYGVCPKAMVRLVVARAPGRGRARRLLLHHRSRDGARRRPLALRRTLGDRSHLPRRQADRRRRAAPDLEGRGARARRPPLVLHARHDLALVPHRIGH